MPTKTAITISVLAVLTVVVLVCSLVFGGEVIAIGDVLKVLWARGNSESAGNAANSIVWNLRVPRSIVALLAGANLAVSGVLLQAVMRNPLAAPNIVGVTAGAGLGATLVLAGGSMIAATTSLSVGLIDALLPAAAFVGGVLAALVVYALSWRPGTGTAPVRMVLAGVAVTAVLGALTTFVMLLFPQHVQSVVMWLAGSLNGVQWQQTGVYFGGDVLYAFLAGLTPYAVAGLIGAVFLAKPLDLLQLGDGSARSLGVPVERVRFAAIALAALLAGSAVAVGGLIAFVGLVVPHVCRLTIGPAHKWLIPASALGGAVLLGAADLAARTMVPAISSVVSGTTTAAELPVGILTALIGGPYFLFLLYRTRVL